jgi:arabinofuranosyltransferase
LLRRPTRVVTTAAAACAVLVYALLVWQRRWMCDDGWIAVRTVRQILAGHGPVFNAFERAEANTSTLWTWLLAGLGWLTGDPASLAVALGGLLAVAALVVTMDATRRLLRARGSDAPLVPAGALVVVGVAPFWDFATSGLETGLCFFWIAAIWWSLVALRPGARALAAAVLFGLGPLVRPELALVSVVFLVAGWRIVRPGWRRTLALGAAAAALPVAYEIFRAGYYGTLVPLPALAKSAAGAEWLRGLKYLGDFVWPYWLFVPFVALVARRGREVRDPVVLAPVVAALLCGLYVVRVGGDFMHARLLLPATWLLLCPAALLPLHRSTAPSLVAIATWALLAGLLRGDGRDHTIGPKIHDERVGYVAFTHTPNPLTAETFIRADEPGASLAALALRDHRPALITEWGWSMAMNPSRPGPIVYVAGRLGTGGLVAPLDGIVADLLGLANPLGARLTKFGAGGVGHEKQLPWWWTLADFGDPSKDDPSPVDGVTTLQIRAARHALSCGALAELLQSTRAPLTWSRFVSNLTGAFSRTLLVIPADPFESERLFCSQK